MIKPFIQSHREIDHPPSEWLGLAIKISDTMYASWFTNKGVLDTHPIIWHWCPKSLWWIANTSTLHTIVSKDPLHLEPSYYLPNCCGLHGWIRDGKWVSTG